MSKEAVSITTLDPQRLVGLRDTLNADIQKLVDFANTLQRALATYNASVVAITTLESSSEGQPILLPLTNNLYVAGEVATTGKVMVDIGTGYYVEMSTSDGADYCRRRMAKLQESLVQVTASMREKQGHIGQVEQVLHNKMAQFQAQQAQSRQAAVAT